MHFRVLRGNFLHETGKLFVIFDRFLILIFVLFQAYKLRQANSVKIAKIVAFTVILSSFILGSFMLGSTYLQAKATCDQVSALDAILNKELMLETMQQVKQNFQAHNSCWFTISEARTEWFFTAFIKPFCKETSLFTWKCVLWTVMNSKLRNLSFDSKPIHVCKNSHVTLYGYNFQKQSIFIGLIEPIFIANHLFRVSYHKTLTWKVRCVKLLHKKEKFWISDSVESAAEFTNSRALIWILKCVQRYYNYEVVLRDGRKKKLLMVFD